MAMIGRADAQVGSGLKQMAGNVIRCLMTEDQFRKIALSLPETVEKSHVGHPDFRVRGGRIFATLGYPEHGFGVLILIPDQQGELIGRYPEVFAPVKRQMGKTW